MVSLSKIQPRAKLDVRFGIVLPIMALSVLSLWGFAGKPLPSFSVYLMIASQLGGFVMVAPKLKLRLRSSHVMTLSLWLLLALVALASTFWSDLPELTLQRTLMVFVTALMLTLTVYGDPTPEITFVSVARVLMWLGTLLAFLGLVIYAFGDMHFDGVRRWQSISVGAFEIRQVVMGIPPLFRISSLTGNPNNLAARLMLSLVMTIYLHRSGNIRKSISGLAFLVQVAALCLTYSRAGIGSTLIMVTMMSALFAPGLKAILRRVTAILACIVVVFGAASLMVALPESDRFSLSLVGREVAWNAAWEAFLDSPVGGIGFGVSQEALVGRMGIDISVHSAHLTSLVETGLIGYGIFIGLWMWGLAVGVNRIRTHQDNYEQVAAALAVLSGLLVHQMFEAHILRYGALTAIWTYLIAYVTVSGLGVRSTVGGNDES